MYVAVYGRLSMWAPLTSKSTPRGEADMVFGGMGRRLALVRTWKAAIHQRVACATARSMCLPLLLSPSRSHTRLLRYRTDLAGVWTGAGHNTSLWPRGMPRMCPTGQGAQGLGFAGVWRGGGRGGRGELTTVGRARPGGGYEGSSGDGVVPCVHRGGCAAQPHSVRPQHHHRQPRSPAHARRAGDTPPTRRLPSLSCSATQLLRAR
jgi:hypothetical protein